MGAFIVRRLLSAMFILAVVVVLVFNLLYAVGDPAAATLGAQAGQEQIEDFKERYGLNEPKGTQLLAYLGVVPCLRRSSPAWHEDESQRGHCGLLQGDLGESFAHNESVSAVMATRLPRTLLLGFMALLFELIIGVSVGIIAANYRNSWIDSGAMSAAFLGISLPTFVSGPLALLVLSFLLGWFPLGGYGFSAWEHVEHALLPAFTLAIIGAATYARLMRSEMIDTLQSDFIRTAKAKGLSRQTILWKHAARNSLLPVVTLMGLSLRLLVGGAIITEQIFNWPGMGKLAIDSIVNVDAPTVMGVVLVTAVTVQIGNLLADIAVALLDPRVRVD